ncbi:hypothetical protein GCM10023093_26420 [Nemorincola caseinilytica]|uniref:WG repeat-containing protein n=1 Tax=Nemorincola caseinilytica TaxID=2054315 RepID=A0ABP8NN30_9BACT
MRAFFTAALLFSAATTGICQDLDTTYIPYRQGKLWGYCTSGKKIIIPPQFDEVDVFYGPLTTAKKDSQYCIINRHGEILHKSRNWCTTLNNGAHYIATENSYTEQLFGPDKQPLTKVCNKIGSFNKYGYAQITTGYSQIGLMDRSFKEVLAPAYGSIEFFTENLLRVYESKTYTFGLVQLSSGRQLATGYGSIYEPREGLMMVARNGAYGFIDMMGREVIPLIYHKETPNDVGRDERYNESTYEDFRYDGFYEGLAVVVKDDKAGYIDKQGRTIIPFIYERAFGFRNDRAWVKQNGKWGIIDKKGNVVIPITHNAPNYVYAKELEALDGYHEGLIAIEEDTLWGYADTTGKMVIPARYTRAMPFQDGRAAIYKGDLVGFIDRMGRTIIPPRYKWVEDVGSWNGIPFNDGLAIAMHPDEKWVVIDTTGKQVLPYKFSIGYNIHFEKGIAYAAADDITYVFNTKGKVLYTFPKGHSVFSYTTTLFFDHTDQCYVNIRTGTKYCDR